MRVEKKHLIGAALAVLAFLSIYVTAVFSVWTIYSGRIYPGVSVAGEQVSFKTESEVTELLRSKTKNIAEITIGEQKIKATDISLSFKITETAKEAIALGLENPFLLGRKTNVPLKVSFDQKRFYEILKKKEAGQKLAVENPIPQKTETGIEFAGGKSGVRLNYAETSHNLIEAAGGLETNSAIAFYTVSPAFSAGTMKEDSLELLPKELILNAEGKEFKATEEEMVSWLLGPTENKSKVAIFEGEAFFEPFYLGTSSRFNSLAIESYLGELGKEVNKVAVNAVLSATNGAVVVAKPEVKGKALDVPKSTEAVVEALTAKETKATLTVETKMAEIRSDNLADLGLKELVSTGYSNFTGSPVNRIHNVRTGASKFNGVIIKPGAEFSFNTILGPVDASTGYLPELVILENKTQPQFGGGLCQVSSTAFRAALNAGFPIIERKAHAYPVSYYKPFGVDATIYLPKPDFRFKNDSSGHILVQTRIVGKNLYFDFYGTKPKRRVAFAGGANAAGAVPIVERVSPYIYDQGARGSRSFSAMFYRFIYDEGGKLINSKYFLSKYDSPDKYPH